MDQHKFFLENIREGGFYDWIGKDKPMRARMDYFDERYYENPVWPSLSDSEEKLRKFISEALEAEEAIVEDLMSEGMTREEAIYDGCQWPLVEDAPIEAIRAYLKYEEDNAEAAAQGVIID